MKNANWAESGVPNVAGTQPIKELGRDLRLGHKVTDSYKKAVLKQA